MHPNIDQLLYRIHGSKIIEIELNLCTGTQFNVLKYSILDYTLT